LKSQEIDRQSKLLLDSLDAIEQIQRDHAKELAETVAKCQAENRDLEIKAGALEARLRLMESSPEPLAVSREKKVDRIREIH